MICPPFSLPLAHFHPRGTGSTPTPGFALKVALEHGVRFGDKARDAFGAVEAVRLQKRGRVGQQSKRTVNPVVRLSRRAEHSSGKGGNDELTFGAAATILTPALLLRTISLYPLLNAKYPLVRSTFAFAFPPSSTSPIRSTLSQISCMAASSSLTPR